MQLTTTATMAYNHDRAINITTQYSSDYGLMIRLDESDKSRGRGDQS